MGVTPGDERRWVGPLCAVVGVLGFSLKGILVKLAYLAHPVDSTTLLALRMLYAAPFFCAMAWWASRRPGVAPISADDWRRLAWLGFIGYYLASLLDFLGLKYITASLERLILFLYPTFVVLLSALLLRQPITRRAVAALALSYAGIALVVGHDLHATGDRAATLIGGGLVLGSAVCYALYLVQAGGVIARIGSLRFSAWAMLASTAFVVVQFAVSRPLDALEVNARVHALSLAMAIVSTVLPIWFITESIRRMGANAASLVGALGPVFTLGLGAAILGEPLHVVQFAGVAFVLVGVGLVTGRKRTTAIASPLPITTPQSPLPTEPSTTPPPTPPAPR